MNVAEQLADTIPPVSRCGCGASYDAETWKALPYVGLQDLGDGEKLELRNCRCHSTLAIEVAA